MAAPAVEGAAVTALRAVFHRVQQAAERSGRTSVDVRVVAVGKTKPVSLIQQVYDAGHRCFGENYVQEIVEKAPQLPEDIAWHFIGHLQSNKVKTLLTAVPNLDMVEGVDNEKLFKEMEGSALNAATGTGNIPCPSSSNKKSKRVSDNVSAYTVQCAKCSKWRFIPTKEKYEKIREKIAELSFLCETAREWRPDITCEEEPDLVRDGSWNWAIDKPCIPQPPSGWQRILRIRARGGTRFADLYYDAPSGKRLRSMQEVQSYMYEHSEPGVMLSQFSFQIPDPLEENYVRKRRAPSATLNAKSGAVVPVAATPISWIPPDQSRDLHFGGERNSTSDAEAPAES